TWSSAGRSSAAAATIAAGSVTIAPTAAADAPERPPELLPAERQHDEERLDDDPAGHLRLADAPVPERDRDLPDARPGPARPVRHLDLEDVATGVDALERDRG